MKYTTTHSKELGSLRAELVNIGFKIEESEFPNSVFAIKQNGLFRNRYHKMFIQYYQGSNQFLMMGHQYKTQVEAISYMTS